MLKTKKKLSKALGCCNVTCWVDFPAIGVGCKLDTNGRCCVLMARSCSCNESWYLVLEDMGLDASKTSGLERVVLQSAQFNEVGSPD